MIPAGTGFRCGCGACWTSTRPRASRGRNGGAARPGPWLTSVFGAVLLVTLPIVVVTGLLSYIAYGPRLGQAIPGDVGWLKLPTFDWPTNPSWLYRLTQGLHVGLGLVLIPVVLAKLWSVIPRLFAWPPARSIAQLLERVSLLMLVGGVLFEIVTGVLNIQYDYVFGFSFYTAHYFGAWVFIAGFVVHIAIKIPTMWSGLRSISPRDVLRTGRAATTAQAWEPDGLVAADPRPPTMSRRGALALVGGGALFMAVITAGQTLGGYARPAALLLPRGRTRGDGPNDFEINRTAVVAGISAENAGERWRLTLTGGPGQVVLDRAALLAMAQHTSVLPIACVEGWSTTQTWAGCGWPTWLAWPACPHRSRRTSLRWSAGRVRPRDAAGSQVLHPTRCWPCASTVPTCPRTTASRRASSCPRCPGCTTPNGWSPSTSGW